MNRTNVGTLTRWRPARLKEFAARSDLMRSLWRLTFIAVLAGLSFSQAPDRPPIPAAENGQTDRKDKKPDKKQKTAQKDFVVPPSLGGDEQPHPANSKRQTENETERPKNLSPIDSSAADKEKMSLDRDLVRYTLALAIVGTLQLIALTVQAYVLFHHSKSLKASVVQMTKTVAAYEKYVEIGREELAVTRESNAITKQATELTRQSLILSHRPKVVARNVAVDNEDRIFRWRSVQGGRAESWGPEPMTGTLRFVNIGDSTAHVVAWQCQILVARQLPTAHILPVLSESCRRRLNSKRASTERCHCLSGMLSVLMNFRASGIHPWRNVPPCI
jgi:hypothetical protein